MMVEPKDRLKRCKKCRDLKTEADFTKDSSTKDKLDTYCKTCKSELYSKYKALCGCNNETTFNKST